MDEGGREGPGQRGGGRWSREEKVQKQNQGEGFSGAIPSLGLIVISIQHQIIPESLLKYRFMDISIYLKA